MEENFDEDSNYSDLETPVSNCSYFRDIQNISDIRAQLGEDSGTLLKIDYYTVHGRKIDYY